jgi:hypothetical protein
MLADPAFSWDLYEKKAPYTEPAYSIDAATGTHGSGLSYRQVDADGSRDHLYSYGNGPIYDGAIPGGIAGLTAEQLRHTFKPHTGMNCVPEDKLLVDLRPS